MIFLALAVFFNIQVVSANFACGKVSDAGEVSSSWFDSIVYYTQNPSLTTSCQVSPADNRFCGVYYRHLIDSLIKYGK